MRRRRVRGTAVVVATLLPLAGCGQLFGPKATLGPGSIVRGRGLYNEVISETNNQQTLESIVRRRYGEPLGLLSVASVTANLRSSATTEAQFGFGAPKTYDGNLVPLSVGVAYEENPTISYAPVQGERYAKRILTPVGLDVLVLLLGIEYPVSELVSILVKHINGLQNPMYGAPDERAVFRESIAMLAPLQRAGLAAWTAMDGGGFALVMHDYAPQQRDQVRALLRRWGLPEALTKEGRPVVLPLKLAVGSPTTPALNVQTRSVYDLIDLAALTVEVPPEHAELAAPSLPHTSPLHDLLTIRSSRSRPSMEVLVATRHRGYWFYIAASDERSKHVFALVQSLIGMSLIDAPHAIPTLTIPVGK